MSGSRLSISVPAELEDTIRAAAEAAGLPVQATIADGLAAVAEFEADDGALTDAERAQARQTLIDAEVIPPQRATG
ncbi:MAG: hypothetical protein ACRDRX_16670 [Pseudonocardiaceae bacterium]